MDDNKRRTIGTNVLPINYNLTFEPNLKTFKFDGRETIKIEIKKPTKAITLNATDLKISKASITSATTSQLGTIKFNAKDGEVTVSFKSPVKGNAELSLHFSGFNNDRLYGFYRSKYTYNGKEDYILTSQFEPANAREAFPCFDEPALKATFDLSFIIDKELKGVSNMPIKKEENAGNGKKKITFYTTPKMSSYLLYLGVGKFEYTTSKMGKLTFNIITTPGKSSQTKIAMEFGKKFLKFYEDYFGIKYPLPKMDLIAVPDFSAGAMENWGAITFREVGFLGDEKSTSLVIKQRMAEVIAHELAHQWFGDLVTMKWWDDTWLNESFATFMAEKAVETILPKWEFGMQNHIDDLSSAFGADQFASTHAINVRINNVDEINDAFDGTIAYSKGGCVLEMLEDYAGKETFRKGLQAYLKKYAYSNATKYDLWNEIGKVARKDGKKLEFEKVAAAWIDKPGFPIIEVSSDNSGFLLEQKRYLIANNSKLNDVWPIPVHYIGDDRKDNFILMEKRAQQLKSKSSYIQLNYGQKGIYKMKYQDSMLQILGEKIRSKELSELDGWGIENSLYSLARSSRIKVVKYLNFIEKYCMNCDYPLNFSVSDHLNGLQTLLADNNALYKRIKKLNIAYHLKILNRLSWNESSDERNVVVLLRNKTIASLGRNGYEPVSKKAKEMFAAYLSSKKQINKNIRGAIYHTISWLGDTNAYNKFLSLYKKEKVPEEKVRLLGTLADFNNPEIVKAALDFSLSKDVRRQDSYIPPAWASGNNAGKKVILEWTKKNWQKLKKTYNSGSHFLDNYVGYLGCLDDEKSLKEVKEFFSKKSNMRDDLKTEVPRTLELIEANIRFKEFNEV